MQTKKTIPKTLTKKSRSKALSFKDDTYTSKHIKKIARTTKKALKVEVYEWLFDSLIKFRNDSGDSYKEAAAALYTRYPNKRAFPEFMQNVATQIKAHINVKDWQTASEEQLQQRDKIHNAIKLYSNVLNDTDQIVRLAIKEVVPQI